MGKNEDVTKVYESIAQSKRPKVVPQPDGLTLVKRGSRWIKVVNLVDTELRDEKKKLIKKAHDAKRPDLIDVVIALGMFKEGANWQWAEEVVIIGAKNSLSEHIQTIGRLFRPAPGKRSIKVLQVLPYTFDCMDKEESLAVFSTTTSRPFSSQCCLKTFSSRPAWCYRGVGRQRPTLRQSIIWLPSRRMLWKEYEKKLFRNASSLVSATMFFGKTRNRFKLKYER